MSFVLRSILSAEMYEYLEILNGAEKDTESYVSAFKSLDEYLLSIGLLEKSLPENVVQDWLKTLTISGTTRNYIIARIRCFSRYLIAIGIPSTEPDYARAHSTFVTYTFTDKEFAAIIDVADNATANAVKSETEHVFPVLLRILYGCGLRVGEALALRWEDIDLVSGIITLLETKNNKQRFVPMSSSLTILLKMYHERRFEGCSNTTLLFESAVNPGKPYLKNTFRDWFLRVMRQANISNERKKHFERCISTHTLRHYFTFKSFQKSEMEGRPFEESAPCLTAYLGHETFFSTEKYLTTDYTMYTDSQQKVAAAIEHLFPEVSFE